MFDNPIFCLAGRENWTFGSLRSPSPSLSAQVSEGDKANDTRRLSGIVDWLWLGVSPLRSSQMLRLPFRGDRSPQPNSLTAVRWSCRYGLPSVIHWRNVASWRMHRLSIVGSKNSTQNSQSTPTKIGIGKQNIGCSLSDPIRLIDQRYQSNQIGSERASHKDINTTTRGSDH